MDQGKTLHMVRDDVKACGESLIRAAERCDTVEEIEHLNAAVQAARGALQSAAYLLGKALAPE